MIYWQLFITFLKIGTFTLGGGYAMIPLIQREVVDRRHWVEDEEFMDMLALAQSAPGVIAVNTSVFIGWSVLITAAKRAGREARKRECALGIFCSVMGAVLPSFIIILLIATIFTQYKNNPTIEAIFKGIRPAVVALIAAPLVKMAKKAYKSYNEKISGKKGALVLQLIGYCVPIVATLLIWLAHFNPVLIILICICSCCIYSYFTRFSK